MKIEGTIDKIVPSKKNEKSFSVIIGGERYGYFAHSGGCPYQPGQEVSLEYIEDKGFKNIVVDKNQPKEIEKVATPQPPELTQEQVTEHNKEIDNKVYEIKGKEADKFELGMAKNNAAVLLPSLLKTLTGDKEIPRTKKMTLYWQTVRELYNDGKEVRKQLLGY